MPSSPQRIASALLRSYHTATPGRPLHPRPCQRYFHRSPPAQLPRRRTFFTSNVLLQQDGTESPQSAPDKPGPPGFKKSSAQQQQPPSTAKRKPRTAAKTSLRRVAAIAQLPGGRVPGTAPQEVVEAAAAAAAVDADSSSSNMIHAVCSAEAFDMDKVTEILQAHGFHLDPDGTGFESHEVVHARGVNKGDVFVFESGTIVTWSLPAEVVTRLATKLLLPASEDPFVSRLEKEDLEFVQDPTRETSGMKGDVIVLGTRSQAAHGHAHGHAHAADPSPQLSTTLAKIAFSSGVARSTKLAALETSFTDYFASTRAIPAMLATGRGLGALSRGFVLRKTGELLSLRARLNHYSELTDSLPDLFWDSRHELGLENYYDQVGRALDASVRIRTLNEKMTYAQEIATVLREIASEKHGTRLEWIIIVLIAVEVVFELRRVFLERRAEDGGVVVGEAR